MNPQTSNNPSLAYLLWTMVLLTIFVSGSSANAIAQRSIPLDVLIVLDQSRSMRQNDPKRMVAQAVSEFIQRLPAEDTAGLILFGSQAWSVQSLGPLNEEHRSQLLASIADIRYADSQSNPAAAVDAALDEFRSRGRAESASLIVLLTDGGIDTGSKTRDAEIQHLMETQVLAEVRKQKVRVYPIAFTTDADLSLLEKIARGSGGECYLALTPDALEAVFVRLAAAMEKLFKPLPTVPQPAPATVRPSGDLTRTPTSPAAPAGFSMAWLAIGFAGLIGLLAGGYFFFSLKPKLTRQRGESVPEASLVDLFFFSLKPKLTRQRGEPVPAASLVDLFFFSLKSKLTRQHGEPVLAASLIDLRTGKPFRIEKTVIQIGRKADNDLVIAEQTVSGQHARIHFRKGKFYLEDLQSANETKLNGQKVVGEVELRSGDVVRFDQFGFTFKVPDTDAERTLLRS